MAEARAGGLHAPPVPIDQAAHKAQADPQPALRMIYLARYLGEEVEGGGSRRAARRAGVGSAPAMACNRSERGAVHARQVPEGTLRHFSLNTTR